MSEQLVKVKAKSSFSDSTHGDIKEGGFYKVSRQKADHYVENGLADEIVVQNKKAPVIVTETKPRKPAKVATKQATKGKGNGASGKPSTSKKATARNK